MKNVVGMFTFDEFIALCNRHWGEGTWDYSKVEAPLRDRRKISIGCKIHGYVNVYPLEHVSGKRGCHKCTRRPTHVTTEYLIALYRKKHGDFFDYSKTQYTNSRTTVTITCPVHGDFGIGYRCHLKSKGCRKCNVDAKFKTWMTYQLKAYNGKLTCLDTSVTTKSVRFNCSIHGNYKKKLKLLSPIGDCIHCHREVETKKKVALFNNVHFGRYVYGTLKKFGPFNAAKVRCSDHGWFVIQIFKHLEGKGCPVCDKQSKAKDEAARIKRYTQFDDMNLNIVLIMEECSNLIQALSKVERFGWGGDGVSEASNKEGLETRLGSLFALVKILEMHKVIDGDKIHKASLAKIGALDRCYAPKGIV